MTIQEICNYAEEISKKYNPEGLSPFPYENIQKDKSDLKIFRTGKLPDKVSGVIGFFQEENNFSILINNTKSPTRQYFTIAHELGHYFLHQEEIKKEFFVDEENVLDRAGMLYRRDEATSTKLETEANNFAASLIMPAELVKKAWEKLRDVEDCAEVFNVSVEAMSIRLSRLGLVN
ncbi:MAG: ImmA/IrrE family metallo-endopeptidase [Candidatus Liptonbacteria bacterium]|nr:ImmA/IrrE family metallo-endopeptidase [Candidatus Liptonbacteria bacterium]